VIYLRAGRPSGQPIYHPCDKDLSPGAPIYHPSDKDLSPGAPIYHPSDKDLSPGAPIFHPSDKDLSPGAPIYHPSDKDLSPGAPIWRLIGRPASLDRGGSSDKKPWCKTGPNTWLVEPEQLPPTVIESNMRAWVVLRCKMVFQGWNEAQKRTLIFVPRPIVMARIRVSRVKMNAKVRRP